MEGGGKGRGGGMGGLMGMYCGEKANALVGREKRKICSKRRLFMCIAI